MIKCPLVVISNGIKTIQWSEITSTITPELYGTQSYYQ